MVIRKLQLVILKPKMVIWKLKLAIWKLKHEPLFEYTDNADQCRLMQTGAN